MRKEDLSSLTAVGEGRFPKRAGRGFLLKEMVSTTKMTFIGKSRERMSIRLVGIGRKWAKSVKGCNGRAPAGHRIFDLRSRIRQSSEASGFE